MGCGATRLFPSSCSGRPAPAVREVGSDKRETTVGPTRLGGTVFRTTREGRLDGARPAPETSRRARPPTASTRFPTPTTRPTRRRRGGLGDGRRARPKRSRGGADEATTAWLPRPVPHFDSAISASPMPSRTRCSSVPPTHGPTHRRSAESNPVVVETRATGAGQRFVHPGWRHGLGALRARTSRPASSPRRERSRCPSTADSKARCGRSRPYLPGPAN